MKILVITDRYPPHYAGGYELGCRDAVDALRARHHDVAVLTSTYGVEPFQAEADAVLRRFEVDFERQRWNFLQLLWREAQNQRQFRQVVRQFQPDVVYFWKLNRISVSLAFMTQQMDLPISYYVFDRWITTWEQDPWLQIWRSPSVRRSNSLIKTAVRPFLQMADLIHTNGALDFSHAQLCSHYLKRYALEVGKPVANAEVIHWGVDLNLFPYRPRAHTPERLLYVGRLVPHKGVHTAIQALALLVQQEKYRGLELTIVGDDAPTEYLDSLHDLVRTAGLQDRVHFGSFVEHGDLPGLYQQHDVLLFPSVWDEPFGITLLEAMASGLAVIGTGTGGSGEILQHKVNGLVFPPEDTETCARHIKLLVDKPAFFRHLQESGRQTVEQRFRLEHTMDRIERSLKRVVSV
jgi:glycogen synthase